MGSDDWRHSHREIAAELEADIAKFDGMLGGVPGRPAGRGRVQDVPPQQRDLRPAPGRPQPDGAGQGPVRLHHARAAGDAGRRRRPLQPWLGAPHHPAEHPVPLRRARAGADAPPGPGPGGPDDPGGVRRHRAQHHRAATWPAPARSRCSTSARGRRRPSVTSCTTRTRSGCPRKFKINFSGCVTDCGQAMFNDVGVVAVSRPLPDGGTEAGFPGLRRRRARAPTPIRPRPSRSSPPARSCSPRSRPSCGPSTTTATVTTSCGPGSSGSSTRWASTSCASGSSRSASCSWPPAPGRAAYPPSSQELGDAPAGVATGTVAHPGRAPRSRSGSARANPYKRWEAANVVIGVAKGTVSAIAYARLGDITVVPVPGAGRHTAGPRGRASGSPTARTWPSGT